MRDWLADLKKWFRSTVTQSSFIHMHAGAPTNARELVELIDRFLSSGEMRYPFEWDDFISYSNDNPNLEKVRLQILDFEHLLGSTDPHDAQLYTQMLLHERNRLAALIGKPPVGIDRPNQD